MRFLLMIIVAFSLVGCVPAGLGPPPEVADIAQYQEVLKSWPSELTAHFPPNIPDNSTDAKMSSFPGYLQGGAHFQLRLSIPASDISDLDSKFSKIATHTFHGGDTNDHGNATGGVPTTFDYTNGMDSTSFGDTFNIYVLHSDDLGEQNFPWNHGTNGGVAICQECNQIVYWCGAW